MSALQMKARLSQLAAQHGIEPPQLQLIPLADPLPHAEIILEGIVATPFPNLDRSMFAKHALTWTDDVADVPLFMRHDESKRIGTIKSLAYDHQGFLKISCSVTDPQAQRIGGFSVGATATEWALRNEGSRDFYAEISKGVLCECSLTDRPADPKALVLRRFEPGPFDVFLDCLKTYTTSRLQSYDLQASAIIKTREIVEALAKASGASAAQPRPPMRKHRPEIPASAGKIYGRIPARPRGEPHRASEFGRFVEKLERVHDGS